MSALSLPAAAPRRGVRVSFEFFPPKTDQMEEKLWTCVERLAPLAQILHLR